MAYLNNKEGSIVSYCPGCRGGRSTFEWKDNDGQFGALERREEDQYWTDCVVSYRLFKCAGCGMGAFGVIKMGGGGKYPGSYNRLIKFFPESKQRLPIPESVPKGIVAEFREAETCFENQCVRAAAGLIRSVLDKILRANGYKTRQESNLYKQIEAAAEDSVITQARKRRAHDEIRVLGNDVLHDDWHEIPEEDVEAAKLYCQRILEDFYDDRESVLQLLREAGRVPEEDREQEEVNQS